jgi:uncharacterized protein with von Willebrand factor type A (vWA) domain
MQKKIVEFTNLLRKSGVRVSVAEAIDAFSALDELTLEERALMKDTLRTTMVKRSDDIQTYDRLFDLFWSGFHDALREEMTRALSALGGEIDLDQLMEMLQELLEGMDVDLSELARAMLTLDANLLEQQIRDAAEEAGIDRIQNMLQIGFFSRRMLEQMNLEGAGGELSDLLDRLREAGLGEEELEQLGVPSRAASGEELLQPH